MTSIFKTTFFTGLILMLSITACRQKKATPVSMPDVSSYIYAYTSGQIAKKTPVRVRFTRDLVETAAVGTSPEKDLLKIRPAVAGQLVWEDQRTLRFEPDTHFQSGTEYTGTIVLSSLFDDLPPEVQSFDLTFRTRPLHYDVSVDGLKSASLTAMEQQELHGMVATYDEVSGSLVEKGLTARQGGKDLPVEWEHGGENTSHRFVVKGISRASSASEVELSWNGQVIDAKEKGNQTIIVPAIGDFKVMEVQAITEGTPHLAVRFSDPLQPDQELSGLVNLKNKNTNLRTVTDGNILKIFPPANIAGVQTLVIEPGVRNVAQVKMSHRSEWKVTIQDAKPAVRLVGQGSILPNTSSLIMPFEAIGLKAIEVEVFKIFDNNILQFLQTSELDAFGYDMERVGRVIVQEKMSLEELLPGANLHTWTRYALDLSKMVEQDPRAIYQVRIGFRPGYALYQCDGQAAADDLTQLVTTKDGEIESFWGDYYGINGYYSGFEYHHRKDPCYSAYYNSERFVRRNIVASDLGIIAKRGNNGQVLVTVSDLRTTAPVPEVSLAFYDYQQQLIKEILTDGAGIANVNLERTPFAVVAKRGNQRGYLKMMDGNALSLSRFDVSGAATQEGLKGYLYGERGVWRPGDSIFLNFVLEDQNASLPADHPIQFTFTDPRGQVQQQWVTSRNVGKIYPLATTTTATAPTGNWTATVKVGGATFSKNIRIETIQPNRYKVELDLPEKGLQSSSGDWNTQVQVNWLHGAPAANTEVKIEQKTTPVTTQFPAFSNFVFDDPARKIQAEPQVIFDGQTNADGVAPVTIKARKGKQFPGKLQNQLVIRAFEPGGNFSTRQFIIPESPYTSYAGVAIRKNKWGQKRLEVGNSNQIELVAVNESGKPVPDKNLKVGLYRLKWRWWWDQGDDNIAQFNSSRHTGAVDRGEVRTDAKGNAFWEINPENWGRYLVRVCDEESGHCAGDIFYAGYPWYDSDEQAGQREAAAMLMFKADKESYNVDDQVTLTIPSAAGGRAFISLENGTEVIESYWTETTAGETTFKFYATDEMAPTVYANVTLVQPHDRSENDLPIRMYGVIPLKVENADTRLNPVLKMPAQLEPEEEVTLQVSEQKGQPMAYTVAIVDDGLLDLTNFTTPNPWEQFFAREALGVTTWDLYDHVLGAYGGTLERVLAIGGDGVAAGQTESGEVNRFQPVVKHLGPFYLDANQTATHQVTIPNYIGSVRAMVVAAGNGAYGNSQQTVQVKKPLMVLSTLPRVLGPGEQLTLPVNVFATENNIKNVKVTIEEQSGLVAVVGQNSKNIAFNAPGEQLVQFPLRVDERVGAAKFKVTAQSGNYNASEVIEMLVRNPNPAISDIKEKVLQPGERWQELYGQIGVDGTNEAILEVSSIPPMDLERHLRYLIQYPHGCIEQTTSGAFPQLYVGNVTELSKEQEVRTTNNITAAIKRIKQFQLANGGFSYWPGGDYTSYWGTNYAGHFLMEAQKKGYAIPIGVLSNWKDFQKKQARQWEFGTNRSDSDLTQAYRLYTLALAGSPELGAMNRLRELPKLTDKARWRLAAAYAKMGRKQVAQELIEGRSTEVKDYRELSYTYGSGLRDEAMILETLTLLDNQSAAADLTRRIAKSLSSDRWHSTQTIAYALMAVSEFAGISEIGKPFKFAYQVSGETAVDAGSEKPIFYIQLPMNEQERSLSVSNTGSTVLFVKLESRGQPVVGDPTTKEENLKMSVQYTDLDGNSLDVSQLVQGTDFIAKVTVTNPGTRGIRYEEMALTQIFPSGWEILNTRFNQISQNINAQQPEYRDIRDDRVYSYFDINAKNSQTYVVQLNAAYAGRFYLPTVACEAMYDHSIMATRPGQWVEVVENVRM